MSSNIFYNEIESLPNDSFVNYDNLIFTDFILAPQNLLNEGNHEDKENTTNYNSNSNVFLSGKKDKSSNKESSKDDNSSIDYESFDKIKEKLQKFKGILRKNQYTIIVEKKLCNKKRHRGNRGQNDKANLEIEQSENEIEVEIEQKDGIFNEDRIKRGRKPKYSENKKVNDEHNKMSSDNIIKKIKSLIFKYLLAFGNKMINKNENDDERLYKLDYKYINQVKKEDDLQLLNKELQKILSLDVSPKQRNKSTDSNKKLIEKIIEGINEQPVEERDATTIFALNMKLKDWLDLFLLKKNIDDLKKGYDSQEIENVKFDKIVECIGDVNDLLKTILSDNDELYFGLFVLYLYNYERYFDLKRKRINKNE